VSKAIALLAFVTLRQVYSDNDLPSCVPAGIRCYNLFLNGTIQCVVCELERRMCSPNSKILRDRWRIGSSKSRLFKQPSDVKIEENLLTRLAHR
jgi:hypothetical protein